ncbi:hypothetical protein IYY11_00345 [Methylocystis sp. H62]|uniref:hypothetical protein n=1 Tax=Methylocystis sp. H62 TaxID=2785789 RepID=UPI0018C24426|nr:hypothetical protein [Methylocystis sp. H62]MBG0791962.1 hypothetical protein [Methylocystis sp. H62]
MPDAPSNESVRRAFDASLARELPQELLGSVSVEKPLQVMTPHQEPLYWRVPVRLGERTVGFMDFGLGGELIRYSSRIRNSRDVTDLAPDIIDMLPEERTAKARGTLKAGDKLENAPTLVANQSPTQLTWMFQAREANGVALRIYVTPEFSWSAVAQETQSDEGE